MDKLSTIELLALDTTPESELAEELETTVIEASEVRDGEEVKLV